MAPLESPSNAAPSDVGAELRGRYATRVRSVIGPTTGLVGRVVRRVCRLLSPSIAASVLRDTGSLPRARSP